MKISVVTVCFNAASTLADALQSVAQQEHPSVEHIVIDGNSKDRTRDVVRQHGTHVSHFISEPDAGLYDAMNKGLRFATGDVIAFLNADDWYAASDCLSSVAATFTPSTDVVYGDIDMVDAEPPHAVRRVWRDCRRGRYAFAWGWQPAHPATFMRTSLLRRLGGFDTRYRIAADYAMLARCFLKERVIAKHVERVLTKMRLGGASSAGLHAIWRANAECASALRELGVPIPAATIALKLARKALQLRPA